MNLSDTIGTSLFDSLVSRTHAHNLRAPSRYVFIAVFRANI